MLNRRTDDNGNKYYNCVARNVEYGRPYNDDSKHTKGKVTGEIDVLAVKKDYETFPEYQSQLVKKTIELYEVKTGSNINIGKAKKQLKKTEKHLRRFHISENDNVEKYYVLQDHDYVFDIDRIGDK